MRIKAAVLRQSGLPPPYAVSKPLEIAELDLELPRPRRSPGANQGGGPLPFGPLGDRRFAAAPVPMALGHEAAGIVEAVGEGVTDLKAGDHVVLVFVPSCGRCGPCAAGRPALCEPGAKANAAGTLLSGERRLSFKAEPINHLLGVSAFATHAVVARESCVKIDPDLPLELAALFGCAVLTGVGAVVNTAKVEPGTIGRGGRPRRRGLERRPRREARRRAPDRRRRSLGRQARLRVEARRDPRGQRPLERRRRRDQTLLRRRRRCRLRDGRRGSGARTRLCRDRPRRHDRDRRPAPSGQAHEPFAARCWSPRSGRSKAPMSARPFPSATCRG